MHPSRQDGPRPPTAREDLAGLLLVDKPGGMTSHDVVARIRWRFRVKKVGHGGTLDPMATGLLILLLGRATKLSNRVMGHDKVYEGTLRLGVETDSQDAEGEVTATAAPDAVAALSEADVRRAFAGLTGDLLQLPPMVSAKKVGGVRLYKLARKGQTVEREARPIHVERFELLRLASPDADFRVACSKGTYVRTLAYDAGQALGVGAHLTRLRRTQAGPFKLEAATPLATLLAADSLEPYVMPLAAFAAKLQEIGE